MDLTKYDKKYIRVKDKYGETFTGRASHESQEYLADEYGGEEDGLIIDGCIVYNSEIETIEEPEVHGTIELWTDRLTLRRYRPEDAEILHRSFGTDPEMSRYSGWNPYSTPEMARQTVQGFIESYEDEHPHSYSWVMDCEDVLAGTIGAYDYEDGRIEVGFSVERGWQGRGFATEALSAVLDYLTENEGIPCVTAWCAAENIGSLRTLEKSGMKLVRAEKNGLVIGDKTYDKLFFEYRLKEN